MPNAAVQLTGQDLLLKLLDDLQEYNYMLGSIQGQKACGIYTEKDCITEASLRSYRFKTETKITSMIKNLYDDRFILEGLQK